MKHTSARQAPRSTEEHTFKRFDPELAHLNRIVLRMGGLVEDQIAKAMEDARNVGHTINVTFIVKSLERIGDHSKNIAEYVVFLVKGKDVRHVSPESIDTEELGR